MRYAADESFFKSRDKIESFLGNKGIKTLETELEKVQDIALKNRWPLEKIIIRLERDHEVRGWEYVVVELYLDSDIDEAMGYFDSLLKELDKNNTGASSSKRSELLQDVFYDVDVEIV